MKNSKYPFILVCAGTLAACGGSGSSSDDISTFAEATSAATLSDVETNDQGDATPVNDTRATTRGVVVGSGALNGSSFASATDSIQNGSVQTITVDGVDYVIQPGSDVSDDGVLALYDDGNASGDYSAIQVFGTGTDIDGAGTTDDAAVFVRGLVTPTAGLPTGSFNYSGDAILSAPGSTTSESGSFSMGVDFATTDVSGTVSVGAVDGTITGTQSGNGISGSIVGANVTGMDLEANIFGPAGEEVAGAATGQVDGADAVIGLQGSR